MEFTTLMNERRSIRKYTDAPVSTEEIQAVILAAGQAPSWKNPQTGRYYAVTSPQKIEEVRACLPEGNQQKTEQVPVLLVTTYKKNIAGFDREANPDNELGNQWGAYDLGLQAAYLILKARELGLDTLIMGLRDAEQLRNVLDIPEEETVVSVISLGHRDEDPAKPKRKELEKILKIV